MPALIYPMDQLHRRETFCLLNPCLLIWPLFCKHNPPQGVLQRTLQILQKLGILANQYARPIPKHNHLWHSFTKRQKNFHKYFPIPDFSLGPSEAVLVLYWCPTEVINPLSHKHIACIRPSHPVSQSLIQ